MMLKFAIVTTLLVAGLGLSACETFKGVGRDITGTAETVQGWF